jgi:hypothetical protein
MKASKQPEVDGTVVIVTSTYRFFRAAASENSKIKLAGRLAS